jgi:hypothetical protein
MIITITINNWKKHNRKDVRKPTWFACSNDITENDELYDLTGDEFKAWIHFLCMASKRQSETITFNIQSIIRKANLNERAILSAIKKLASFQIVTESVTCPLRERNVDVTPHNKTRQDKTIQYTSSPDTSAKPELDDGGLVLSEFEAVKDLLMSRKVKSKTQQAWLAAYENDVPWIEGQLRSMVAWESANSHKKNFSRFATNWLNRSWDARSKSTTHKQKRVITQDWKREY